jgi:hypothetical protein
MAEINLAWSHMDLHPLSFTLFPLLCFLHNLSFRPPSHRSPSISNNMTFTQPIVFLNVYSDISPTSQRLRAVFRCLDENGFSLRDFLEEASNSDDEMVKNRVGRFYRYEGPSALIRIWNERLSMDQLTTFHDAILDVALRQTAAEYNKLTQEPILRHPANSISPEKIEDFGLKTITNTLDTQAPCLSKILRGLTANRSESFRATVGSMLVFNKSQKSNYFQMMMGLYLYSLGCPKRVISLLNDACLSVSHQTICVALRRLTKSALEKVGAAVKDEHWFLLYDNINFTSRKFHQRLENTDDMEHGTTATIVIGKDLGDEEPIVPHHAPELEDFALDTTHREHFTRVSYFHLIDVLRKTDDGFSWYAVEAPVLEPLPVLESVTFPLPAMAINQSTVEGNLQVIETVMKRILDLPEDWFDAQKRIIIAGDQFTVSRVRTLQGLLIQNSTRFRQLAWAIPVFQLFHLQMVLCSTILRTHYGSVSVPGSLASIIVLLRRKRLDPKMPCYYTADEFLRNTFEAMVRRLWETELLTEDEATLDQYARNHRPGSLKDRISTAAEAIYGNYFVNSKNLAEKYRTSTVNAALFIRDMVVYLELCASIKSGDIKRIEEVLRIITLMLQAGSTKNYALELLRLMYAFRYVWSPQRKNAIMSSWLINTTGAEDKWIPADLYQEHNNLLTKTIHSAKGSNMSWNTLSGSISANVRLFSKIASKLESQYDTPFNSSYHSTMTAERDIMEILRSLRIHGILGKDRHPDPDVDNTSLVTDMVAEGFRKLANGRFNDFIERMDRSSEVAPTDGLHEEYTEAEHYITQVFDDESRE